MNRPKNWNPNNTNNPIKNCTKCGKEFKRTHNRQQYCEDCKEPVIKNKNGVIPKTCQNCGVNYKGSSPAQKYCLDCSPLMKKKRQKEYKESRKKGYNQKGENNNNWKSGIGAYTRLAFEEYGKERICERCGSEHNILVHHKDRNRHNNKKGNLEVLCKSCHQKEHEAGKNLHPDSKVFKSNKV